jgi:hypothetical protein
MAGPVIILIWTRLRRAAARFAALAARVRAGALPSPAPLRPRAASRPARPRPPHRLPGGFAWLGPAGAGGGLLRGAVAASLVRPGVRGPARRRAADGAGLAPALPDAGRRSPRSAGALFQERGIAEPRPRAQPDTAGPDTAGPDTRHAARRAAGAIAWPEARADASRPPARLRAACAGLAAPRQGTALSFRSVNGHQDKAKLMEVVAPPPAACVSREEG